MNKKGLIKELRNGSPFLIINPKNHKYYGIVRRADKVQTNAIRFEGGSWLYFGDIEKEGITEKGFKISDLMGGFVEYIRVNEGDQA